jgi:glycosyltransferase involved in cell wall biosynthesis
VGRLSPEKGHLVLLDALADLCRRREPVQCKLVGEGPMRAAIERRIETLELKSCVTLMGALPPESVQPLYREADVVVLSSFSEGVPVVLMEALAEARPVVASSVGGVPELVIHGETGLLVPPGDSESLAEALLRLRREPALAQALALQGRLHVTKEFRVDVSAAKLAKLFRSRERVVTANTPAGEWDATVCQTPTMTPNSC